jgi:coenzyme F420-reducing hydrogenase delta subunit
MQKARTSGRDRKLVAGGQKHEVRYTAKKTGAKPKAVRRTVKRVGHSRKRVERVLSGR